MLRAYSGSMKYILLMMSLFGLCIVPLIAQDNDPYAEALRRIEQAAEENATTLDLMSLSLTTLPPEIGQLSNLQALNLHGNQLTTLPPEIGQLSNLQTLDLTGNDLTTLPPEFGQLSNLQTLSLFGNQLMTLPPEFGQLSSLQMLYLQRNQLMTLPPEFGQLSSLRFLDIAGNPLTTLPPEFSQLSSLMYVNLSGSFPFLPLDVKNQGPQAIVTYLRDYQAMMTRHLMAGVAACVGAIAALILTFRWRQQRAIGEKKKRA